VLAILPGARTCYLEVGGDVVTAIEADKDDIIGAQEHGTVLLHLNGAWHADQVP
jgi:hypothetical protein